MATSEGYFTQKRKYLDQLAYLGNKKLAQEFYNCMSYRILLYNLREQLIRLVESRFTKFIDQNNLFDKKVSEIVEQVVEVVRSTSLTDKSLENKAKDRIKKLNKLRLLTGTQ